MLEFLIGVGVGVWATIAAYFAAYFAGRRWEDVRWYVYRRMHPIPKMRVMEGHMLPATKRPPFTPPEELP